MRAAAPHQALWACSRLTRVVGRHQQWQQDTTKTLVCSSSSSSSSSTKTTAVVVACSLRRTGPCTGPGPSQGGSTDRGWESGRGRKGTRVLRVGLAPHRTGAEAAAVVVVVVMAAVHKGLEVCQPHGRHRLRHRLMRSGRAQRTLNVHGIYIDSWGEVGFGLHADADGHSLQLAVAAFTRVMQDVPRECPKDQ